MLKLKIKSYKNSFTFSKIIFCPFVFVYLLCVFVCFYYCFDFETVSYSGTQAGLQFVHPPASAS